MSNIKKAVMYGAGSIGRGFIGQLFYQSGFSTCFIDVDKKIIELINEKKQYTITVAAKNGYHSELVKKVSAISGNEIELASEEIKNCDILATAVGANILKYIAPVLAKGIDLRSTPLNIIVCENMLDSGVYLKNLVKPYIKNIDFFEKNIGFIPASVGRMVPVIKGGDPLEVIVEPYHQLQIDANQVVGNFPKIENIILYSPFESMKKRKLFMHNMSHAVCAYLGKLKGYTYIYEAIKNKKIKTIVLNCLEEVSTAISKQYHVNYQELIEYSYDLIDRYHNEYLKDTVLRVGRDPKRKLKRDDRLVGAALFCLNNDIIPTNIILGIKAALLFEKELTINDTQLHCNEKLYTLISKASLQVQDI